MQQHLAGGAVLATAPALVPTTRHGSDNVESTSASTTTPREMRRR
jgi:hypothetical protein